ncbi:hypothetical protein [Paenibacillus glycinis]|uniref:Lon proteolytic domain-containing protein n=1 Tax=Paenibacillus glycinis TaxID=2697035 RepID=A0ABW9XWT8_9BACL|nr:hypothetical protein [Paenibacillus glycinis]NBD27178.1 hypothetical protein [Paenibacillus glycinis]
MEQLPLPPAKPRNHPARKWIVAVLLLLLPLSIGFYGYLPQYNSFTAPGEIVPVQEIGVHGSVRFVYVREGVTRNRYEKLTVSRSYPDAHFTRVDASAGDDFDDMLDIEQDMKNDTIRHAIDSAAAITDQTGTEEETATKLNALIDETAQYYGNSIGLMLGIGLYEEERREDFSRGGQLTIAGTGTLEEDHSVGSVGAIREKLQTAEAAGADIFFVPKDKETFMYFGPSNEEEALQTADELRLHLHVVPVASLEEAIACLKQLPYT